MTNYDLIMETNESTVVAEYESVYRSGKYQTEADLEEMFIKDLGEQGYEYLPIHNEKELILNLRSQIEELNDLCFTNSEWQRLFNGTISNPNESYVQKTAFIQGDPRVTFTMDDGSMRNILFLDKNNIHRNKLQVIHQYEVTREEGAKHNNRYDVTILVNGLPLVHVELKRRGVALQEAFNQINRYARESFSAGNGLYEYVQIYVISNGRHTKYYSNTTRIQAVKEADGKSVTKKTSNSFEFTSFWADAQNAIIPDLYDFTRTFFARHTLLRILTRYCVFTSEEMLMVMRPYQITAAEKILNRIVTSSNYKTWGTKQGGGYIWHTTGSGKTLTSFKTAQLASRIEGIEKVLFVVDRKDLDYQTMREYDRFEKGAADSNSSTAILKRQLENPASKIIITTIQKLSNFVQKYKGHAVFNAHVVIIFDECHRSQFGDMHAAIVKSFKKYHLFGFTGTPIFAVNTGPVVRPNAATTEETFGDRLHSYTILDAIRDKNVLPFRVEYVRTMKTKEDSEDKDVYGIDKESAFMAPERIAVVTDYILGHFNRKTYRGEKTYTFKQLVNIEQVASERTVKEITEKRRVSGFNAILAAASVDMAKCYYQEFKKQMAAAPERELKIALIYSYGANEEEPEGLLGEENPEDPSALDTPSRDFLESAIQDYNRMFRTNYSTDGDSFQSYYKDVSLRMKNRELDLLIVVNMFLTGFDATTLNTLWVDKNLKMHGLIQAFSRTNRILNSVKTFGNIICFRNLQQQVDEAVALFGDKNASGVVLLRPFLDYLNGFTDEKGKYHEGYKEMIAELKERFPLGLPQIIGEGNQKDFLRLFGSILRTRNILTAFDEFEENDTLDEKELQDYLGMYQDIRDELTKGQVDTETIDDDIVFETELVRQIEINIDYILMLVEKYHEGHCLDKEILTEIRKAVNASPELRSKKDLIEIFITRENEMENVMAEWKAYIAQKREEELAAIIREEKLNDEKARTFVDNAFQKGELQTNGMEIDNFMPPISRFGGKRAEKKRTIIEKLKLFFERFFGL